MKNKYLTKEQVKREARRSLKAALRCSLRHWKELRDATLKDFEDNCGPWSKLCSLCQRFIKKTGVCVDCPLDNSNENCFYENSIYVKALMAFKDYKNNPSSNNELTFRRHAQDMVTTLNYLLLKEIENEQ